MAAHGPLGCHGNNCAPMLAAAVSRERAQGNCWHDRMVWAVFFPQVPGLARVHNRPTSRPQKSTPGPNRVSIVRSTRARPPVPILDLGGYALW